MIYKNVTDISLGPIVKIAIDAGHEILRIYNRYDYDIEFKNDCSPLTMADKQSHQKIATQLQKYYKNIPILSEEGADIPYSERKSWNTFWLVDPLDGTKEFIKRNGEFTVNIALIENQKPVLGVIYVPVLDTLYVAKVGVGSFKIKHTKQCRLDDDKDIMEQGTVLPCSKNEDVVKVIASRSHLSQETEAFIEQLKEKHHRVETMSSGSSLKLCLVAEGACDYYPRFAPTMEWDTAAGHVIVEQARGYLYTVEGKQSLTYNKPCLRNPWFIVENR
ncbi:3'(2'),5'-bisphosphate nucleotidase [Oceanobacillus arenosus]|uniref:3'(2'),5'-bisphosphate nucleotidase CysQ n=1 Tax=Oceanobacillus arenosus TaxID=1229153 RepID=A0A3D8PK07_9BACI|nr:3'(2'),5'-bisphosphate nucleotidase CysQ [Oceanobacillus arenosus]RDW16406.1 3'(2'),5'-bisphosphate nucleotidase [Oceanobacillus arenosus]